VTDSDLTRAAQGGDAAAFGVLLERHRARLLAHALRLVGPVDAHDAVQDTFVVAMRRIGSVRDPGQVEGWLHTVLRNVCMDRLRTRTHDPEPPDVAAPADDEPESVLDSLALRDWVWTAIGRLSDPLRLVTMLRHFSCCTAYEDIAAVCDVPVGTVRSRLSEARRILADDLLRTAATAHDPVAELTSRERDKWSTALTEVEPRLLYEHMSPDVEVRLAGGGVSRGREAIHAELISDREHGIGVTLDDVIASRGITIIEGRFENPPEHPFHCPPGSTQVAFWQDEVVQRMVVYYAPRPSAHLDGVAHQ
jgi:RNA polymerase sigma-70 factor (ECF subfamily)